MSGMDLGQIKVKHDKTFISILFGIQKALKRIPQRKHYTPNKAVASGKAHPQGEWPLEKKFITPC